MTRPTGASAAPFAPGSYPIAAHGGGAFAFAGMRHDGSILAPPRGIRPLSAATPAELDAAALAPLFEDLAEAPGSIEYLVIGTGAEIAAAPPTLRTALREPASVSRRWRSGRRSASTTSCRRKAEGSPRR